MFILKGESHKIVGLFSFSNDVVHDYFVLFYTFICITQEIWNSFGKMSTLDNFWMIDYYVIV